LRFFKRNVAGVSLSGYADPEAVLQQHFHVVVGGILNAQVGALMVGVGMGSQ
jgi:hypothetical protein